MTLALHHASSAIEGWDTGRAFTVPARIATKLDQARVLIDTVHSVDVVDNRSSLREDLLGASAEGLLIHIDLGVAVKQWGRHLGLRVLRKIACVATWPGITIVPALKQFLGGRIVISIHLLLAVQLWLRWSVMRLNYRGSILLADKSLVKLALVVVSLK